jgi:hypothetical protein
MNALYSKREIISKQHCLPKAALIPVHHSAKQMTYSFDDRSKASLSFDPGRVIGQKSVRAFA